MSHFFTLRNLLRVLWRRLPLIVLFLAIGLPLSVWFALSQPRLYEATAIIQIETPQISETAIRNAVGPAADTQLDLIQQKLTSRDRMADIVTRFDLFSRDLSINERVGLLRGAVVIDKLIDPSQAFRPDVTPSGLVITVRLDDADRAAAVANDLLEAILAEADSRAQGRAARTLDFFVAEEARVADQIAGVETERAAFKQENTDALPENLAAQQDRLTTLLEARTAIDRQLIELRTGADRLREDYVTQQTALLEQQRSLLDGNIVRLQDAIAAAPEVERQLSALDRRLTQLDAEYQVITAARTEAAMAQLLETQDQAERFEVLETAIPPENPVSASRRNLALAGGILTVIAALALVFAIELTTPVIRNADQLEAELGIRPVITIPHLRGRTDRRRRRGMLVGALFALVGAAAWGWRWIADTVTGFLRGNVSARGAVRQ